MLSRQHSMRRWNWTKPRYCILRTCSRSANAQCLNGNRVQAMMPRGTRVIPNPHGTAPVWNSPFLATRANSLVAFSLCQVYRLRWLKCGSERYRPCAGDARSRYRTVMFHTIKFVELAKATSKCSCPTSCAAIAIRAWHYRQSRYHIVANRGSSPQSS